MRHCAFLVVVLAHVISGKHADAQGNSRAYVEVTLGANALASEGPFEGEYFHPTAPMLRLAIGTQPDTARPVVAAFHLGWLSMPSSSDVCRFTPLGGCYQDYPYGGMLAITFGARPARWRFLEMAAGPAYIGRFEGGGRSSFGAFLIGRTGQGPGHYLAPGITVHALLTTLRGHFVPSFGVGLSFRTW